MKKWLYIIAVIILWSCSKTEDQSSSYEPTPYQLEIPKHFRERLIPPLIPANNLLTVEGVALGKKLFFDKSLSSDNTKACASCHLPKNAFSDPNQFSTGINNKVGKRHSMPIFNLAWNFNEKFFWDGHKVGLEKQAGEPVLQANELGNTDWETLIAKLEAQSNYLDLFEKAFKTKAISKERITKAIAQFERTLISGNSKFDQYTLGNTTLTTQELDGLDIFMSEGRGDCFHCHGNPSNPLWTDNDFHNNGLDSNFTDLGLENATGNSNDRGKFKSPSLRNLAYTAPYMHDGRFATLDEVIEHYSTGLKKSSTIDPLMKKVNNGGVHLTTTDKANLKAFLLTLSDPSFISNPSFNN